MMEACGWRCSLAGTVDVESRRAVIRFMYMNVGLRSDAGVPVSGGGGDRMCDAVIFRHSGLPPE